MSPSQDLITLSLLVANRPGLLGRIALVFSRRGFNIEALSVNHTLDQKFSNMLISVNCDRRASEQLDEISKQARNLVDVMHLKVLGGGEDRAKVKRKLQIETLSGANSVVLGILRQYGFEVIDFADGQLTVRAEAYEDDYELFFEIVKYYGSVRELN